MNLHGVISSIREYKRKRLLYKFPQLPYHDNKSIHPCFWAQRQNSVKNSDIYWQIT